METNPGLVVGTSLSRGSCLAQQHAVELRQGAEGLRKRRSGGNFI